MASDDITETLNDISVNACFEWDVLLGPEFKQLNKSFETLCHNGQKFREKSGNVQRGKESKHIDKYRSQYVDEVLTLASNIKNVSQMCTDLPKPSKAHGGFYSGELTSKVSSVLCGLGHRKTGKQPSAQDITDNLIRQENQDLKKQLTDLETNLQVLEKRYAKQERQLEAELQEKNDLLVRYADLERRLEAELQEKNDLSERYADLERRLEAESQKKNDLSERYADLERRMEAELQEKNDLSVRYADLERRLIAESQEKNDLSDRYADLERRLEAELQEKNDLSERYADLERRLEAELQDKNDLSERYADLERRLEAELQEKNDMSKRYADLERRLEAELQKKNDLSDRYAYLDRRLEAELQKKNDLSVRYAGLEGRLETELQEKNDLSVRYADRERSLEAELQEKKDLLVRYADLESSLKAELQEKNDLSKRNADLERSLEAELQEKNDLSVRYADLERSLEAELQEKNDLLGRNAYMESRLEAELQKKNDLSVRIGDQEGNLRKENEMRQTEKAKADKSQSHEEFEIMEEKQRYTLSLLQDFADITMPDSFQTAPQPQGHLKQDQSEESDCVGGRIPFRDIDQKTEHRNNGFLQGPHRAFEEMTSAEQRAADLELMLAEERKERKASEQRYTDLERRLEAELQDKNDLSVSLSTTTGSRIKDGNTTIVDLSDENRPTKLAEYFSELFDNEWTDCFDELEKQAIEESESIRILLKILTDKEKLPPRQKEEVELPDDILQPIKEIKKRRALKVLPTIHEFVRRKIPTLVQAWFASTYFQTYIQKCTEFSWLAVVQDPPLVLLTEGGTKFDRKLFKEYMRRGQFVEFVVWPALLVGEGGAILSKGVAQGINKPS